MWCDPCKVLEARDRAKAWYNSNQDRALGNVRAYQAANPERVLNWKRKHSDTIPREVKREKLRTWRALNPALNKGHKRARSVRVSGRGACTQAEWEAIVAKQRGRCEFCKKKCKLSMDHIVPVSKGGSLRAHNVQGLCRSCNSRKWTKIEVGTQFALF